MIILNTIKLHRHFYVNFCLGHYCFIVLLKNDRTKPEAKEKKKAGNGLTKISIQNNRCRHRKNSFCQSRSDYLLKLDEQG